MADTWWVLIPPDAVSSPDSYKEQVDFRVNIGPGDPNYKLLQERKQINYGGQPLVYWKGPFATEAQALAAQNPKPSPNPKQALSHALQNGPLSGLAAIGDFFQRLSQGATWVRVGEVVLGLIFLAVGVARITHAVPIATKVAKTVGAVGI